MSSRHLLWKMRMLSTIAPFQLDSGWRLSEQHFRLAALVLFWVCLCSSSHRHLSFCLYFSPNFPKDGREGSHVSVSSLIHIFRHAIKSFHVFLRWRYILHRFVPFNSFLPSYWSCMFFRGIMADHSSEKANKSSSFILNMKVIVQDANLQ